MKKATPLYWALAGLVGAGSLYYIFWPDVAKHMRMMRQRQFLEERIAEEENKGAHLKKEQEGLSEDPVQIEKVAREKLGLSRPHEIIYRFEGDPVSQQDLTARVPQAEGKPPKNA